MSISTSDAGNDEQSMEEILQSIRRIIAEEEEQEAAKPESSADEVFELTDFVDENNVEQAESPVANDPLAAIDAIMADVPAPAPVELDPIAAILAATPEIDEDSGFGDEEGPAAASAELETPAAFEPQPFTPPPAPASALVSDATVAAAAPSIRSIQELAQKAAQPRTPPLLFRTGTTVEDLMLEALRPMLRDWLEANLQLAVEKIVQREISRIIETAGNDL